MQERIILLSSYCLCCNWHWYMKASMESTQMNIMPGCQLKFVYRHRHGLHLAYRLELATLWSILLGCVSYRGIKSNVFFRFTLHLTDINVIICSKEKQSMCYMLYVYHDIYTSQHRSEVQTLKIILRKLQCN